MMAELAAKSRAGVIDELLAGTWTDPATGRQHGIPIEDVAIAPTLDGTEAELVRARHPEGRIMVVHDAFTREALGARVLTALKAEGGADELVWANPRCTEEGVAELSEVTRGADVLIAVGSGTVSDSVKYATFLDGRPYSVFPTSPMNAYTTPTASVASGGMKRSITCHSAKGVWFDLGVLSKCPQRLVAAAFADVICRTTAQVDWLLSHLLLGTPYSEVAYTLLAPDEAELIAVAGALRKGDPDALATLTRVSTIMGLATSFTGTTHVGSMGEHMVSHAIDMFAADHDPGGHPGTSHGEQVGVATLTMSALQNRLLGAERPPKLGSTAIPQERLRRTYGEAMARTLVEATRKKALDGGSAERLNADLDARWDAIAMRIAPVMRSTEELHEAMGAAGCLMSAADLGLAPTFYRQAVRDARYIRDRFTTLDVADDAGVLEPYVESIR